MGNLNPGKFRSPRRAMPVQVLAQCFRPFIATKARKSLHDLVKMAEVVNGEFLQALPKNNIIVQFIIPSGLTDLFAHTYHDRGKGVCLAFYKKKEFFLRAVKGA
jgi:hypothetical protein